MRFWYICKDKWGDEHRQECEAIVKGKFDYETYKNLIRSTAIDEWGIITKKDVAREPEESLVSKLLVAYRGRDREEKDLELIQWIEKQLILECLETSNWRQDITAEKLNLSSRVLNYRVQLYGITHRSWPVNRPDNASILAINQEK